MDRCLICREAKRNRLGPNKKTKKKKKRKKSVIGVTYGDLQTGVWEDFPG